MYIKVAAMSSSGSDDYTTVTTVLPVQCCTSTWYDDQEDLPGLETYLEGQTYIHMSTNNRP
jgi:hypothetical protein